MLNKNSLEIQPTPLLVSTPSLKLNAVESSLFKIECKALELSVFLYSRLLARA